MSDERPPIILDEEFMGVKDPMWELNKEQPWHRSAAYAFVTLGANIKDVARQLGKSEPAVQNLFRQKWFQKEVAILMEECGARDIMKMFKAEGIASLGTLVELRDNPRVPAAARIASCKDILDRGYGKPVQRIEATGFTPSDDPVAEVERLEAEVNRLRHDNQSASSEAASYGTNDGCEP